MKNWEDLRIDNDFIFGKVMRDPGLCKRLIEIILDIKVERIEYPEEQKTINIAADARSVRLDVYASDGETVYDIEMQATNQAGLPLRSRYYQGMVDLNLIEKGSPYKDLKNSYIIFICTFDPFNEGLYKYSFEYLCKENPQLHLNDGTGKVFLNAKGTKGNVSDDLKKFLQYVAGNESGKETSGFLSDIENAVEKAKNNEEWRREYMTLLMRDQENIRIGREEGLKEGLEKATLHSLKTIMVKINLSLEDAMTMLSIPEDEKPRYRTLINK